MSLPVRHLSVLQNWDCQGCSHCCREYAVAVSDEERRRIEAHDWSADPVLAGRPAFVKHGWLSPAYRLNHTPEGACVFLTPENRCRIHEVLGREAKPLACRLYPFVLVPVGDHWRVGLRYSCPASAGNEGEPVAAKAGELTALARDFEARQVTSVRELPPPPLHGRRSVGWEDLQRFVKALTGLMERKGDRVELRLRKCLALAGLCRQADFTGVRGGRLDEFLGLIAEALEGEVPARARDVPFPGASGRLLFRQLVAMYARQDRGRWKGLAARGRLALFLANCRFALGAGPVPKLNALIGDVTFADLEPPRGDPTPAMEDLLERYYLVKLQSMQFAGATNFGLSFWDGLDALALTYPITLWLSRAVRAASREEALAQALSLVDDHFGFNPVLRKGRYWFTLRLLAAQGELPKLIAWYSR